MAVFSYAGVGDAFVGEQPGAGVVANADEFAAGSEQAGGGVVEGV